MDKGFFYHDMIFNVLRQSKIHNWLKMKATTEKLKLQFLGQMTLKEEFLLKKMLLLKQKLKIVKINNSKFCF